MIRMIQNREYASFFNDGTGEYFRTGKLDKGKDTGKDVFMGDFPELLDVGIMGHCTHGKSGLCIKAGVECYQNGLTSDAPNMTVSDFEKIVNECRGKTYQIALGGCGDPDCHEDFEEILKLCRENGIVLNFTTSGLGITEQKAALCKKYCGAVAVSWYRSGYTLNAVRYLLRNGVKTNIHYVLCADTVKEALERLRNSGERKDDGFPEGINAVIFLLHKPVGQGSREKMITQDNKDFQELLKFIDSETSVILPFKIGFDSCTVPALLELKHLDPVSIDTCEGGRWSAYISPDMYMMPCSFAHEKKRWKVSLRDHSVHEAWNSDAFDSFRQILLKSCGGCEKRELCMGGCPVIPEIVLCRKREGNK